jgi:hypothetical protein
VESYDGSNSYEGSTPGGVNEGTGSLETPYSNEMPSSAINFDSTALVASNMGDNPSPNVRFVDDSANASSTDV